MEGMKVRRRGGRERQEEEEVEEEAEEEAEEDVAVLDVGVMEEIVEGAEFVECPKMYVECITNFR